MSADRTSNLEKTHFEMHFWEKIFTCCNLNRTQTPGFEHILMLDLKILCIIYFLEKMIVEHGR